jgi:hypothetical protein
MESKMRSMMLAVLMAFLAGPALADDGDSAIGNETPTADQAKDKVESETAAEAEAPGQFKIPAGYLTEKRGKKTVYCKKAMESGTRFAQKKCYDEEQLRAMELAREEQQTKLEQTRKVCGTPETCAGG